MQYIAPNLLYVKVFFLSSLIQGQLSSIQNILLKQLKFLQLLEKMLRSTMLGSSRLDLRIDISSSNLQKPYYTTLDEISGRVIFAPQSPTLVKDILIDFLGIAKTWVDPSIPGSPRRQANCQVPHPQFLELIIVSENE
jgi:hypothetical protein